MFEPTDWRDWAACRGCDPEAFVLPLTPAGVARAKDVCAGCPVRVRCREDTPAEDRWTIRGGFTPDERAQLAREGCREFERQVS